MHQILVYTKRHPFIKHAISRNNSHKEECVKREWFYNVFHHELVSQMRVIARVGNICSLYLKNLKNL